MKFGRVPLAQARDAVLAHSLHLPDGKLKKGRRLSDSDLARIASAGLAEVVAARLGPGDVDEDAAADRVAAALVPDPDDLGLIVSAPFTGRVNIFATRPGLTRIDGPKVDEINSVHEAITLATLPDAARVSPRQMIATVKIIPYAAPGQALLAAEATAARAPGILQVQQLSIRSASLLMTRTSGMSEKVLRKGADAVRTRLIALGISVSDEMVVAHDPLAIGTAMSAARGEMVLLLTASATSDRSDVGPSGLVASGGRLERFGMPVDPGNLLFLGEIGNGSARRPVVGLPGCVRSPKLNGADWVLERLAHGRSVDAAEIASMGVGGLLKEIPSRPQPRAGGVAAPERPRVSALILAAGASRRMGGRDKLLEPVAGQPLLTRVASAAAESAAEEVLAVLRPADTARAAALADLSVRRVENARAAEGMGTSLAAGLAAIAPDADAVVILLADMPEIGPREIDRLIAAFDPEEGRAIVRATSADGTPGHPVLFGRRFFESLAALGGDVGARQVIAENQDFIADVALPIRAALTDLDTPEAWSEWRAAQSVAADST